MITSFYNHCVTSYYNISYNRIISTNMLMLQLYTIIYIEQSVTAVVKHSHVNIDNDEVRI